MKLRLLLYFFKGHYPYCGLTVALEKDSILLVNNPKYSDIEILCGDKKKLYDGRAILAARFVVVENYFIMERKP